MHSGRKTAREHNPVEKPAKIIRAHRIGVIPGDGTGPEVVTEGLKVLEAVAKRFGVIFQLTTFSIGGETYKRNGTLLPEEVLEQLRSMDAIFLGAIGDPDVKPGVLEREILLKLRFSLDLYINLRPIVLLPGAATPLKDKGPGDIDFVVIRENSEGMYAGGGGFFKKGTPDEVALQESINTRKGVERCIRYAYEYCRKRDREKHLTLCAKTNVLAYESDLWYRVFQELHGDYGDVEIDYQHVDALCMWMIKNPEHFDVIVTNNLFGDIITDIGAIIQGGMGIAAGGNINPEGNAMFEPIGGSAPKYTGLGNINPMAAIAAVQMMLEYLGEDDSAHAVLAAMKKVVKEDLQSLSAGRMGYSTSEVGDLVVAALMG